MPKDRRKPKVTIAKVTALEDDFQRRLGERIRAARLARRVSIDSVASRAGLTKGFLSKVERGEKAPAISSLINVANALNVDVSRLLENDAQVERVCVVRKEERPATVRYASAFGYRYVALAHKLRRKHMEPFLVILPRNPRRIGAGLQHPGEEFVLVVSGKALFTVGDQEFVLKPGDALYFDSSIPHWGRSLGSGEATALDISFVA